MAVSPPRFTVPPPNVPLVDKNGQASNTWWRYWASLVTAGAQIIQAALAPFVVTSGTLSLNYGAGLNADTGTLVNTGVLALTAGTGIAIAGAVSNETITNAGVLTFGGVGGAILTGTNLSMSGQTLNAATGAAVPGAGVVVSNGTILADAVLVGLTLLAGGTLEPDPAARVLINSGTVAATGSSTIASDWSAGNVFANTMTASATLASPSNVLAGTTAIYIINAGTTGALTLAYGAGFIFNSPYTNASPPAIGAGVNILTCVASGTATIHSVLQPGTWA